MQIETGKGIEPTMWVTIGDKRFTALLDSGSSRSLLGHDAMLAAAESGSCLSETQHVLQLAAGSSMATYSLSTPLRWQGGALHQAFLYLPGMNRQVILGRDFLHASGISIHIHRGEWSMGQTTHSFGISGEPIAEFAPERNWLGEDLNLDLIFTATDDALEAARVSDTCLTPIPTCNTPRSFRAWQPPDRDEQLRSVIGEMRRLAFAPPKGIKGYRADLGEQSSNIRMQPALPSTSSTEAMFVDTCIQSSECPEHLKPSLRDSLVNCERLFTTRPGKTSLAEHTINTGDHEPVKCKLRPINSNKKAILDGLLDKLISEQIIQPSSSSWASAPVLVAKKSGGYRLAVDYRPLNKRTQVPVYAMPTTESVFAQLGRARWFTVLDLSQGFHQIPLAERDRNKTAFLCHRGLYEYVCMPFGLAGSPARFQQLMDKVLGKLKYVCVMPFLDDIVIFSESAEEHLLHINMVLHCLAAAGLTINPLKVQFFQRKFLFLGHILMPGECRPDPAKVVALRQFPKPTKVKELQSFLGLVGYYRAFIPGFAHKAAPLTDLLHKQSPWTWGSIEEEAFNCLINSLVAETSRKLPDLNKPFVLETDASGVGIAAILLQESEGILRPIEFISRKLNPHEKNYTVQEWECLAVVWAVERFRPYLEFTAFEIHCDHASLVWMFKTEQTSSRVKRWVLRLQGFDCVIKHRKGSLNIPADALSRAPAQSLGTESRHSVAEEIFPISIENEKIAIRFEDDLVASVQELNISLLQDSSAIAQMQREDDDLQHLIRHLEDGSLPSNKQQNSWVRNVAPTSAIHDGLLVRFVRGPPGTDDTDINPPKIWLPQTLRGLVLNAEHDHPLSAHKGYFATLRRVQRLYTWLGMRSDVARYVRSCTTCQKMKPDRQKPAGKMDSRLPGEPFAELSVDLIGPLPTSPSGNKQLLVVLDKFTKYVEIHPLKSPTTKTIVKFMVEYFCRHGFPKSISSDNGKVFVSKIWKGVLGHFKIIERHTVPYRPAGQAVERYNASVKQGLAAYCDTHRDWDKRLDEISFALRTTVNSVTGYTPAFLCHGRELRCPWEVEMGSVDQPSTAAPCEYASDLKGRLTDALNFAKDNMAQAHEVQRHQYNARRREESFELGDLVLKKEHTLSDASKGIAAGLAPKRSGPFRIVGRLGNNVYELETLQGKKTQGRANVDQLFRFVSSPDWVTAPRQDAPLVVVAAPPPAGHHRYNLRHR